MFSNLASLNSLRSVSMSSSKIFFTTIFSPLDGNSAVKTVEKPPRPISSLFLSSLNLKTGIPVKSDEDVLFCIFQYFSSHQTQTFSTKPSYYMFCKQAVTETIYKQINATTLADMSATLPKKSSKVYKKVAKSKACFIRRISVASNAIQTTDNEVNHLIIHCLNCIRRD